MRIHAYGAIAASIAALAVAPFASAHGTWWSANAERSSSFVESFAKMQAASTEAPAFHAGDGSIYDATGGRGDFARMARTPQPATEAQRAPEALPERAPRVVQQQSAPQSELPRSQSPASVGSIASPVIR